MDISCRLAVAFALFFAFCPMPALGQGLVRLAQRVGQRRTGRNPRGRHGHGVVPFANRRSPARDRERQGSVAFPGAGPRRVRPGGRAGGGLRGLSRRRHQHRRGRLDRSAGSAQAGRCCPVDKRRGGLERRVALERARDPVRPRLPRDYPHAAVQHVRRDPERAGHVADVAVERHRQHGVLVRIRRERERVHDRRHHLHLSLRRRLAGRAER